MIDISEKTKGRSYFLVFFFLFFSNASFSLIAQETSTRNHLRPYDVWAAPGRNFDRDNLSITFYIHHVHGANKLRLSIPENEHPSNFYGQVDLLLDGKPPDIQKDRGTESYYESLHTMFRRQELLAPGESIPYHFKLEKLYKIGDWTRMTVIPQNMLVSQLRNPPKKRTDFTADGFRGELIVHDPYISSKKRRRRSERKPRLDTFVVMHPENNFHRDNPVVTFQYRYVADGGSVTLRLPDEDQIKHFDKMKLYSVHSDREDEFIDRRKEQKTNHVIPKTAVRRRRKDKAPDTDVTFNRTETLHPGDRVSFDVNLSTHFELSAGWEKLRVKPTGNGVPSMDKKIPRGFTGSYIVWDWGANTTD